MPYVFVSYVRNNRRRVQRLCDDLTKHGIEIWLDRNNIKPGERWKEAIRRAINQGAFFIACFSRQYNERDKTYMNEELALAIEELRRRPTDKAWFIPVKLNECEIPDRNIGAGEILRDIQWIELYRDWSIGIQQILNVIQPVSDVNGFILFDETHNQATWDRDEVPLLHRDLASFAKLIQKKANLPVKRGHSMLNTGLLDSIKCLILICPREVFLSQAEIDHIKMFARTGGACLICGYYLSDKHHRTNLSNLTESFGVKLCYDLVADQIECFRDRYSIRCSTPEIQAPTVFERRLRPMAPYTCSLEIFPPSFPILMSSTSSYTEVPEIIHAGIVKSFKRDRDGGFPVGAAREYSRGRVVVLGSWEMLTDTQMATFPDNSVFLEQVIEWLLPQDSLVANGGVRDEM